MATKGTKKLMDGVKAAPAKVVSDLTHNLGIAAKPLSKMTTKEVMDLMSKIYFTPGAIEQIESTLSGRKDSKGPLSRVEKQVVSQNPVISNLVKKMCIEKAMLGQSVGTWNAFWDGVKIEGKSVGNKTAQFNELLGLRDNHVKSNLSGRKTFKEFMNQFGETLDRSMMHSKNVMANVDYVMKESDKRPVYAKQRAKNSQTIDRPTIDLIERMNGSEEHITQAINFINYLDGKIGLEGVTSGPYTYSELARITMTTASRDCVIQMRELQKSRSEGENEVSFAEKMTEDERKSVEDANARSQARLSEAARAYKDDCTHGNVSSLKRYAERINKLRTDEKSAREVYLKVVRNVRYAISRRESQEGINRVLEVAQTGMGDYQNHIEDLSDLSIRACGIGIPMDELNGGGAIAEKVGGSGVKVEEIDTSGVETEKTEEKPKDIIEEDRDR